MHSFLPDKEKKEVTPVKEDTKNREKEKISKKNTRVEAETRGSASSNAEWCCYLLKIILGVLLILAITYIFYRFRKPKESSRVKVYGHIAAGILFRSMDRSDYIYKAMLSRGFDGEFPEGNTNRLKWTDLAAVIVFLGIITTTRIIGNM